MCRPPELSLALFWRQINIGIFERSKAPHSGAQLPEFTPCFSTFKTCGIIMKEMSTILFFAHRATTEQGTVRSVWCGAMAGHRRTNTIPRWLQQRKSGGPSHHNPTQSKPETSQASNRKEYYPEYIRIFLVMGVNSDHNRGSNALHPCHNSGLTRCRSHKA